MKDSLKGLLLELWADLHDPGILWQVAVLALCLGAGWGLARASRLDRIETSGVWTLGVGGLKRILVPLLARALVLDEAFDYGALHTYFITYEMSRSGGTGDPAARSRQRRKTGTSTSS